MAKRSKTTSIKKHGQRVSITPNHRVRNGIKYKSFIVRATILGERKTHTAKTLKEAEEKAAAMLAQVKAGGGVIATYTPQQVAVIESALEVVTKAKVTLTKAVSDYADAVQHLPAGVSLVEAVRSFAAYTAKQTHKPITLPDLAGLYLDDLRERMDGGNVGAHHHRNKGRWVNRATKHFKCLITDITSTDIEVWLRGLKLGPVSTNHHRGAVVGLFRYAQRKNYLSRVGKTEADYAASETERGRAIEAYTPEQAAVIMANIDRRWLAFAAIGFFAGLRREEIFRLSWDEVKADHIEVTAAKSKTKLRRVVPILPVLQAWLNTITEKEGMVCPTFKTEATMSATIGYFMRSATKKGGFKPIQNGLRHSFISYRVASIKNLNQTAYEAGNSPEIITEHYNSVVTESEAAKFFSILPPKVPANVLSFAA
jgi:integrase